MRLDQLKLDGNLDVRKVPCKIGSKLLEYLIIEDRWQKLADNLRGYYGMRYILIHLLCIFSFWQIRQKVDTVISC